MWIIKKIVKLARVPTLLLLCSICYGMQEPETKQQRLLIIINQVHHEFEQWNNRTESLDLSDTAAITDITDSLITNNTSDSRGLLFLFALDRTSARQYLTTLRNFLQIPQNNVPEINTILGRVEEIIHTVNNSLNDYSEQIRRTPSQDQIFALMQTQLSTQQAILTQLAELCTQINELS